MEIRICKNSEALGKSAAEYTAQILKDAIAEKGSARIVLSTGASQFDTIKALVEEPGIQWDRVEMFHLDEYVDLPETHVASFRKYLKERFVEKVGVLKAAHFVDGTKECIAHLTAEIRKAPIDVGLIGIGENAHIAFNDPPADFDTKEAYIIVNLNANEDYYNITVYNCPTGKYSGSHDSKLFKIIKAGSSVTIHPIEVVVGKTAFDIFYDVENLTSVNVTVFDEDTFRFLSPL